MNDQPLTIKQASTNNGWETKPKGWNDFSYHNMHKHFNELTNSCLTTYDEFDYIAVLAGGLDENGQNNPWVKDRLDIAIQLYHLRPRKIIVVGGGTYHRQPCLNSEGFVLHESTICAKYLIETGDIPFTDIYKEWASYDTIANGFFVYTNFILPLNIKKILVITSDFHITRTKLIFDWMNDMFTNACACEPVCIGVSTKYLDQDIIEARNRREQKSVESIKKLSNDKKTLFEFNTWFYTEHKAYNNDFNHVAEQIDENTKKSY